MRIFGTDGVRGLANGQLTGELALGLGVAAARVLVEHGGLGSGRQRPLAVVGRDTRISGQFLEHAVVAGLASAGVDVLRLRVLPTPGVAYFTDALGADVGVVISASHNPMPDNGIKFLARGGVKLDDALEREIEEHLDQEWDRPTGADVGRVTPYGPTVKEYAAHLVATLDKPLVGLKVVLDCANGAASEVGPQALTDAGAEVIAIGAEPDGLNINEGCGSTHLEAAPARRRRARRRRRLRGRRRRRPLPGRRPHRGDRRRRPDHGDPRARHAGDRRPRRRHPGRDGDEQPRARAGAHRRRRHRAPDRGGRPLRARGHARRRLLARRRAVRPRDHARARHHRRRPADRAARDAADGRDRQQPAGARRRDDPAAPGAGQRPRRRQGPVRRPRAARPPSPPPRPTWATPAGCCCARPAPSRWCG